MSLGDRIVILDIRDPELAVATLREASKRLDVIVLSETMKRLDMVRPRAFDGERPLLPLSLDDALHFNLPPAHVDYKFPIRFPTPKWRSPSLAYLIGVDYGFDYVRRIPRRKGKPRRRAGCRMRPVTYGRPERRRIEAAIERFRAHMRGAP